MFKNNILTCIILLVSHDDIQVCRILNNMSYYNYQNILPAECTSNALQFNM